MNEDTQSQVMKAEIAKQIVLAGIDAKDWMYADDGTADSKCTRPLAST